MSGQTHLKDYLSLTWIESRDAQNLEAQNLELGDIEAITSVTALGEPRPLIVLVLCCLQAHT